MLLFVYTTARKRFEIFTSRCFKLSWNTTALSQSNCRNVSCSSIKILVLPNIWNLIHITPTTWILNALLPKILILHKILILPNIEILISHLHTWNSDLILPNNNLILTFFLQTLELWPFLFKHWNSEYSSKHYNSDLFLPNIGILTLFFQALELWLDRFKSWNAALPSKYRNSKLRTAEVMTAFFYL